MIHFAIMSSYVTEFFLRLQLEIRVSIIFVCVYIVFAIVKHLLKRPLTWMWVKVCNKRQIEDWEVLLKLGYFPEGATLVQLSRFIANTSIDRRVVSFLLTTLLRLVEVGLVISEKDRNGQAVYRKAG